MKLKYDLVRYTYSVTENKLWFCEYMNDAIDRETFEQYLDSGHYNLRHGVYLYKKVGNQFKLVAIINEKGIKKL